MLNTPKPEIIAPPECTISPPTGHVKAPKGFDFRIFLKPLKPNRADINQHLFALFHPDFVMSYPDAKIEIAIANPKDGGNPKSGQWFSAFDLQAAGDYAEAKNRKGLNVYVGVALRQGETPASGRASKSHIVTASRAWADFDGKDDDARVYAILTEKGIQPAESVETGTIPHRRFQMFFKLAGNPSKDGLDPGNPTGAELEAVNAVLKDQLGGGGDDVQNMDRLMRLAGSVSYPPPHKVERGYVPELTKLYATANPCVYSTDTLIALVKGSALPPRTRSNANGAAHFGREQTSGSQQSWGRSDRELEALLELSRMEGKWHNAIRSATATMVGRGWSDSAIRLVCGPYCEAGAGDADLDDFIDRARAKGWGQASSLINTEIAPLLQLTLIQYEQQRKAFAKKLDVRVSQLDRMVESARQRNQTGDIEKLVAEINTTHALVIAGNKAAVMKFEGRSFRLWQTSAFQQWYANQSAGRTTLGDYWLSHPDRRQYGGIEFAPDGATAHKNYYNLFQGFAVEPKKGDCSKFLAHMRDNVACGDEDTYRWNIGWWAQIFQQPNVKMETALVLRGPMGAGKTKIGKVMGSLIGDHYLLVANQRYITGQFNAHMASLLVLHADEAFWAGDKASVGTLRDLVSNDTHMLEHKGIDPIQLKNYIRLFVTGNPDWMVPAGFLERRWAVFDMGEEHAQDHAYFAAIDHEMDNGGREALLHHLLNFDLTSVDLRTIPKTTALLAQQIESMTTDEAWWFQTLMDGELPPAPHGVYDSNICSRERIFEHYLLHTRVQGLNKYRSLETKLGMFLRKMLGSELREVRPVVVGKRLRCYQLPPLAECRRLFNKTLGQAVDWGPDWEKEEWRQCETWHQTLMKYLP